MCILICFILTLSFLFPYLPACAHEHKWFQVTLSPLLFLNINSQKCYSLFPISAILFHNINHLPKFGSWISFSLLAILPTHPLSIQVLFMKSCCYCSNSLFRYDYTTLFSLPISMVYHCMLRRASPVVKAHSGMVCRYLNKCCFVEFWIVFLFLL